MVRSTRENGINPSVLVSKDLTTSCEAREDPISKQEGRQWPKETTGGYLHSLRCFVAFVSAFSMPNDTLNQVNPSLQKLSWLKVSRSDYFKEVLLSSELLPRSRQNLISSSLSLNGVCSAHNCFCVGKKIENRRGWMESLNTWEFIWWWGWWWVWR